jgi:hypothetical protein
MTFDWKATFGDVLTAVSILISVVTLATAWWKDRLLRRRELADKIRAAAAKTLAKLERKEELSLALFVECQPLFVKVSEELAKKFDVISSRDELWRELNVVRLKLLQDVRKEDIETPYAELYAYHPEVRDLFRRVISTLKTEEKKTFEELLRATQDEVMAFEGKKKSYQTADLGNALREAANGVEERYQNAMKQAMALLQSFLLALISQSDTALLDKKKIVKLASEKTP